MRWMVRGDLSHVVQIEYESSLQPWSGEDFERELKKKKVIAQVVECDDGTGPGLVGYVAIVGFVVYELFTDRIRLLNMAVSPGCRRQGYGRVMIENLAEKLTPKRRRWLSLDIRETNLAGQQFFRACGFRATEVLRDWYDGEDAFVMQRPSRGVRFPDKNRIKKWARRQPSSGR